MPDRTRTMGAFMKKLAFFFLCVLAVTTGAMVSEFLDPRLTPILSRMADQGSGAGTSLVSQPVQAEASMPVGESDTAYPKETVSPKEIRDLFEKMDFETLTARLEEYQSMFEEDFRYEYHVYDAFQAFDTTNPTYEILLDAWLKAAPNSFAPHMARATHYRELGSSSRGAKWAKDTSESQFVGMRHYYQMAEQEALEVLKINPNVVRAATLLMNIRMNFSDHEALAVLEDHASTASPYAYIFRANYMLSLLPRWGGSYNAMDDYVRSCEKYFRFNPRLKVLKGYKFSDMGDYYRREEDYSKAIDLYNQALSFGPDHNYLRDRGRIYYIMDDYGSALADLNKAVSLRPTIVDNYDMRSKIHYAKGDYEVSLRDLDTAIELQPTDSGILKNRQWCCNNLMEKGHRIFKTDKKGAIEKYSLALRFDPDTAEVWYWRGVAYSNLRKYEESRQDVKRSIELNPAHFESVRLMDSLLARKRRWDEIIEYWNDFLQLNPDHADALMERSGTYYHAGKLDLAMLDLEKSCELGNMNACNQYRKMKR